MVTMTILENSQVSANKDLFINILTVDTRKERGHKREEIGYGKEVRNEAEDLAHQTGDIAGGFAAHRQLRGNRAFGPGRCGRRWQL